MKSMLEITSHGKSGMGVQVSSQETTIKDLTADEIFSIVAESGYIIFRGFSVNIDTFSLFVSRLSSRVSLDPAREFHSGVAQKVDAGIDAIGLHCENGNSPFLPDLCWFYCNHAPIHGSQTTVCDGYDVWNALSSKTQKSFISNDIVYSRTVDKNKWRMFVFHSLGGSKPIEQIILDDLLDLVRDKQQTRITLNSDGSIHYLFQVSAAHPTLFGERIAFSNSILGPSYNYEKPVITFSDGSPIDHEIQQEIMDVSEQNTVEIDWHDNDIVLIDNTRVMHGRRKIVDTERLIFNALSYVNQKTIDRVRFRSGIYSTATSI